MPSWFLAAMMTSLQSLSELTALIQQARSASRELTLLAANQGKLLELIAREVERSQDDILEANTLDLEASLEMAVPDLILDWLKLTPERLQTAAKALRRLAGVGIPQTAGDGPGLCPVQSVGGYRQWEPLGVVALVYEAFPELALIAAGLCLRTGNSLILKGGNEASQTNQAIAQVFQNALEQSALPEAVLQVISPSEGESARRWLMQTPELDLVIPYGRSSLVQQVRREANSPVLATAIANCYLYWARSGSAAAVAHAVIDSHWGIPEPVNGIEKILVDEEVPEAALEELLRQLQEAGFTLRGALQTPSLALDTVDEETWKQPHLNRTLALRQVSGLTQAIALINECSSGHADCIVTESYRESCQFARQVCSASVYINASPRFMRNPAHANAIALGMSAQRGHNSGRVGLDALLTAKSIVQGISG